MSRTRSVVLSAFFALAFTSAPALAEDEPTRGPHGGVVVTEQGQRLEVVFLRDAVKVYRLDAKSSPVPLRDVGGAVEVRFEDEKRQPAKGKLRQHEGHLKAKLDLERVPERGATATIALSGLPGHKGKLTIQQPFRLANVVEYACPMRCEAPRDKPGKCGPCGMALKASQHIYACPMHPEITARDAKAKCSRCGMAMKRMEGAASKGKGHAHGDGHGHGGHGH